MTHYYRKRFASVLLYISVLVPSTGIVGARAQDTPVDRPADPSGERVEPVLPETRAETPSVGDEDLHKLSEAFAGDATERVVLDTHGLLIQKVTPTASALRMEDLGLVVTATDHPTRIVQKRLVRATSSSREELHLTGKETLSFALTTHDQIVHRFTVEVLDVFLFNKYLVFVEAKQPRSGLRVVSFIDLEYFEPALGQTVLPIGRMPVRTMNSENADTLSNRDEHVFLGQTAVPEAAFRIAGGIYNLAFNQTVALLDPKTYQQSRTVVESFWESYKQGLRGWEEDQYEQVAKVVDLDLMNRGIEAGLKRRSANSLPVAHLQDEKLFQEMALKAGNQLAASRKTMARAGLLWHQLTYPQALGAPKIVSALEHLAATVAFEPGESRGWHLAEAVRQGKSVGIGASAAAAAIFFPDQTIALLGGALGVGQAIVTSVFGAVAGAVHVGLEAIPATFGGWDPSVFSDRYLNGDALTKLAIGTAALAVKAGIALGVPYFIINALRLRNDMHALKMASPELSVFQRFIERQNIERVKLLAALSDEQAKLDGGKTTYTQEDTEELRGILQGLNQSNAAASPQQLAFAAAANSLPMRILKAVTGWNLLKRNGKPEKTKEINTLSKAVAHFFVSFASLTNAGIAYIHIWNSFFIVRSWAFNVPSWLYFLTHPDFFSTAISNVKSDNLTPDQRMAQLTLTLPTVINGGDRGFVSGWRERIFGGAESQLAALEEFERKIIPMEQAIQRHALESAMQLAIRELGPDDLRDIARTGMPNSIWDRSIKNFPDAARLALRAYFEEISREATRRMIAESLEGNSGELLKKSDKELRHLAVEAFDTLRLDDRDAGRWVAEATASAEVHSRVQEILASSWKSGALDRRFNLLTRMNPQTNRQTKRAQLSMNAVESPKAVARSVRSMIASVVVDKPMEFVGILLCFATAQSALLAVIQPEMHSATSSYYLSTYLFGTGFLVGVIMDVMSGPWMKVQNFAIHTESEFNNVPEGADAQRSFWGWFAHNAFFLKARPDGSGKISSAFKMWWENQSNYYSLITANLKAALVTSLVINSLTLGRFDIDMYLLGYMACYALPMSGMQMQADNAFELANGGWDARLVPERLRSHPEFQEFVLTSSQKRRTIYNVWEKVFENVTGYLTTNWIAMTSATYGTRGLARAMFGGYTPTELVVSAFRGVTNTFGSIPGVAWAMAVCESVFSNNYEAWKKIGPPGK